MSRNPGAYTPTPERFRDYLLLLARASLCRRGANDPTPSDVVQQTLLEAVQKRAQFRGQTDAEFAGWLRRLLGCTIADAVRARHCGKRDVARECSLQAAVESASLRLEFWLAAEQSTPSERAEKEEDLIRLATAMAALPEDQCQAIELKHLQGMSLAAVAETMGRSVTAVGGLLRRGMTQLREWLSP